MPKMIGMMRLGRDAELRYTPNNEPVTNLSLAYAHGKAGQDGKRPTQWIDATLWGKRAEALTPYLTKGGLHCFTLDELHLQTFQKQDGSSGTKIVARVLDVELGGARQDAAPAPAPAARPAPPPQRQAPTPAPRGSTGSGFDDMDSDIPFRDPLSYRGAHWLF